MKLKDIHTNFRTDKGTRHNYLDVYDSLFFERKDSIKRVLEIGTLFGGSLKMWNEYFKNAEIHGIEDFSQALGFGEEVNSNEILNDLSNYKRIKMHVIDSSNLDEVNKELNDLKFDVIIDDASHKLTNQISNLSNCLERLSENGIYIIEDVQSMNDATILKSIIFDISKKLPEIIELNIQNVSDDRLIIFKP